MKRPTEPSTESAVLDWFERALEQPTDVRDAWLASAGGARGTRRQCR